MGKNANDAALEAAAKALKELYALVWGECPSLLNEDSGGNAELDMQIQSALDVANAALGRQ